MQEGLRFGDGLCNRLIQQQKDRMTTASDAVRDISIAHSPDSDDAFMF